MGEAKRKTEAMRQAMLDEMHLWIGPASDYERQLATEIGNIPAVTVRRPPRAEMIRCRLAFNWVLPHFVWFIRR